MGHANQKPKILIVDDNPENIFVVEQILKKLDADIIKATSGNEALIAAIENDFALILLDVQMPEMDGYEVAEILKSDEKTENIPIIFVTAIDRDSIKEIKGYKTGAVDFLFKPLNEYTLTSKVKIFLEIYNNKQRLGQLVDERTLELQKVVDELLHSNAKLKKSEYRYRTLFEKANDAILIIQKTTGALLDANQAAMDLTGRGLKELKQLSIEDIVTESDENLLRVISQPGTSGNVGRVVYIKPDNEHRTTDMDLVELDNSSVIAIAKDITHDLEIENQLRQAHKMESIGTLAGGIAHDFNNILFPIMGHTEMLLENASDDSPLKSSLEEIFSGTIRARDLVRQILTFARQENIQTRPMKIQHIIEETLKLIRSTLPTTIEIRQTIDNDCSLIKADPTQVHQIIMNLSTNAYHAMQKEGGLFELALDEISLNQLEADSLGLEPGRFACLTVSDTGSGMDEQLLEKIFDPFFTTKENGKGTGMGLSVVHGIVKNLNGAIKVESKPDIGTQFSVYFPIIEKAVETSKNDAPELNCRGTERILFIDDEQCIVNLGKALLTRLGYEVTGFQSSLEALENFRSRPHDFDMVITDMTMPNMPGDKLSEEILKTNPDIPVLLLTGYSNLIDEKKALEKGIKGFLKKPITKNGLAGTIRAILDENK